MSVWTTTASANLCVSTHQAASAAAVKVDSCCWQMVAPVLVSHVCVCVSMCTQMSICVYMCENSDYTANSWLFKLCYICVWEFVCVCVCVWNRHREGERVAAVECPFKYSLTHWSFHLGWQMWMSARNSLISVMAVAVTTSLENIAAYAMGDSPPPQTRSDALVCFLSCVLIWFIFSLFH